MTGNEWLAVLIMPVTAVIIGVVGLVAVRLTDPGRRGSRNGGKPVHHAAE